MTVLQLKKNVQLFDVESYIPKCTIAHHAIQIQDAHDGMQKPRCTFCNSKAKRCPCNAKPYAHYAMHKPRCTLCNAKTHMHNMKCKNQTSTVQWQGYYAAVYLSIFVLTHLPLHLLLAIYENYLYQNLNLFHVICSWTLKTRFQEGFLKRAKLLLDVMEGIQGCFGFFILVDITLMLVYWLLHTYHAYFTCEVKYF